MLGIGQKHIPNPCVSLLLPIAVARLYIQHRGRRTQPIPVVPHSIGFRRHAPHPTVWTSVPHSTASFLAAGAITFSSSVFN